MREYFNLVCAKIGDQYRVKYHMTIATLKNVKDSHRDMGQIIRTHIEVHDLYQRI